MQRTDIYWQGHRIGSMAFVAWAVVPLLSAGYMSVRAASVALPDSLSIQDVATLRISFDPAFAELRGIAGAELEPAETTEEVKEDISRWLGQRE